MRTVIGIIALFIGTIPTAGCQCDGRNTITASIVEGSRSCAIVKIPKDWDAPREYPVALHGLYRTPAKNGGVLFSLQNPFTAKQLALTEKYWIDIEHRGTIRVATDTEWEAAKEIPRLRGTPTLMKSEQKAVGMVTQDDEVLSFNGHELSKSGGILLGPHWPPGDRYVAISSFDGWCERNAKGFIGKVAANGPFFVDVYNLATGQRLAKIKGHWCDWTPQATLGELRWLSDNDLVLPFGRAKRDIVVCHFN